MKKIILTQFLIEERNTPTMYLWGFELLLSKLEDNTPDHSTKGQVAAGIRYCDYEFENIFICQLRKLVYKLQIFKIVET